MGGPQAAPEGQDPRGLLPAVAAAGLPIFNSQRAAICVGQGPWEQPATTYALADILRR